MKNIDELLKVSLSSADKPSEELNRKLKAELRSEDLKGKSISIWWLPLLVSIFMTMITIIIAFAYIPYGIVKMGVVLVSLLTMILSMTLTFVGTKCFELKKGAVISL